MLIYKCDLCGNETAPTEVYGQGVLDEASGHAINKVKLNAEEGVYPIGVIPMKGHLCGACLGDKMLEMLVSLYPHLLDGPNALVAVSGSPDPSPDVLPMRAVPERDESSPPQRTHTAHPRRECDDPDECPVHSLRGSPRAY